MSDARSKVLRAVDASKGELIRFLSELVKAKSITGDEQPAQELVREKLRDMGGTVDYWRPSAKEFTGRESFISEERPFRRRPNVVARFGKGCAKTLAFNGHIDVVPEGDLSLWKRDPFGGQLSGGRVYGRGSCDMKGGLAASIFAISALQHAGVGLENDLMVQSVIGEESGGVGTLAAILRGHVPDAAIIAEPTGLSLLTSQAGCLMFRLRVAGRAAHGASRYLGVSAVEKFGPVMGALLALEKKRSTARRDQLYSGVPNPVTLSIGTVRAGNWDSTVPEELVAEGRYGVWPGESLGRASSQFEDAVRRAESADTWLAQHPTSIEWYGPQWESAAIAPRHWLPRLVESAAKEALGKAPARGGSAGGTDMRLFTNLARVPAVIYGPGDDAVAHFSDESVEVKEVLAACRVYALAALAWG
jgi:acetylornithine deacetylase